MTQGLEKPTSMRVPGIFGIPNDIRIVEMEVPNASPDGFVLKVERCGLCNSEVKMARRGHPVLEKVPLPMIAGHEFSGVVVEVGDDLKGIKVGDRLVVMALIPCGYCRQCRRGRLNLCENYFSSLLIPGGFAPYISVEGDTLKKRVFPVPDGVEHEQAALSEPIACVINGIERAQIYPGDTVVILGAGFMGLLLTNLASVNGAGRIISIDQYPHRLDIAKTMGASQVVNFKEVDSIQAVGDLTNGANADVVIEATGNPRAYEQAFSMVGRGGRVIYFGGVPSGSVIELDPNKIHYQEVEVTGAANPKPVHVEMALELLASGKIDVDPLITHRMKALDLKEAMEFAVTGEPIKIMLYHE
jgi:L-iditol 2-dehydrogenase